MSEISSQVHFGDNRYLPALFGTSGQLLKRLGKTLNITFHQRGNVVTMHGKPANCDHAEATLRLLYERAKQGHDITSTLTQQAIHQAHMESEGSIIAQTPLRVGKLEVSALNRLQQDYITALQRDTLIISHGVAGTGKTHLAVVCAMQALLTKEFDRIVLTRPVIEAGEKIGFLPGDIREKIDPYLRPVYDAMYSCTSVATVNDLITRKRIEIAPLAYMRGRTLRNAFIVLDEAQNATRSQMRMFLTRLGEQSRMVITGDPSQSDLPSHHHGGLNDALTVSRDLPGVSAFHFRGEHVIRHALVAKIIQRYAQNAGSDPKQETHLAPDAGHKSRQRPLAKDTPKNEPRRQTSDVSDSADKDCADNHDSARTSSVISIHES